MKDIKYKIENGCWICISHYADKDGYFNVARNYKGKVYRKMHRYIYQTINNDLNHKDLILHKCNNSSCINPAHLEKGSHKENMKDRLAAGHYYNEYHPNTHINEDIAAIIKKKLNDGNTVIKVADSLNVSQYIVADIKRGRTWVRVKPKQEDSARLNVKRGEKE
ncbi:hypothetical protein [Oceanobacillus oncorhynchi]|uniref:hypothetical protein n=1 Tax=Oceanobacillus oncorhynchi TaxID=545501 RepID=UPI0034D6F0BC